MPRLGQRHIQACRRKSRPLGIRADRRGARPSWSLTKRLETPCELSLGQARVEDDGELGDGGEGSDSTATQAGAVVAVGSGDAAQGVFRHRRRGNPGRGVTLSAGAAARDAAPRRRRTKSAFLRPRLEIFRNVLTSSRSSKSSGPHVDLRCE